MGYTGSKSIDKTSIRYYTILDRKFKILDQILDIIQFKIYQTWDVENLK